MPRRVLLLLSQLPHDPTSGAAITVLAIARLLADAGFTVRALGTSALDAPAALPLLPLLAARGIRPEVDRRPAVGKGRPIVRYHDPAAEPAPGDAARRHIRCTVLDVGPVAPKDWDFPHGNQFNRLLVHELETFQPEIVLTFGGTPSDQARRSMCALAGAAVVFALSNLAYLHPLAFEHVDAVLTPSRFLADLYAREIGLRSTPIPPPIDLRDTLIDESRRDPRYFTFINPTPAKGLFFFVTLADALARARPDIPLQVIEARGRAEHVRKAAAIGGLDLSRHPNLRVVPTRPLPRGVLADARAVLVPSVWAEAFGRVAVEAMHNGIPPIVSGRGGLAEAVGAPPIEHDQTGLPAASAAPAAERTGGLVIPIPKGITINTLQPVTHDAVREWADAVIRLHDDAPFAAALAQRARETARAHFDPAVIAARYVEFFTNVRAAGGPVVAPAHRAAPV